MNEIAVEGYAVTDHTMTWPLKSCFLAGFGGGFKCNSAVWQARRDIKQAHDCWE